MKKALLICSVVILPSLVHAVDISVGSTKLSIPVPSGFAPVTSDMKPYAELAARFVPPSNEQFALFLPREDAVSASTGGIPDSERRFYVQTAKDLIAPIVTTGDFSELKHLIKNQNEALLKKAEEKIPGFLEKVNKGISSEYDVDLGLAMTQMLPLPPHYETERGLAYSMIVKYNVNDKNGKPSVFEGVVTATFVHVQGKVLFLYANAEKSGLAWSRAESRTWADKVIAANPSLGVIAVQEASRRRSGIDWSGVLEKTLYGAIIAGIVGFVSFIFKRMKA